MYAKHYKISSGKTVKSVTSIHVAWLFDSTEYIVTRYIGTGRTRLVIVTHTPKHCIITRQSMTFGSVPKWLQLILRFYEGRTVSINYKAHHEIQYYTFCKYPTKRIVCGNWFDYDFLRDIIGGDYV